MRLKEVGTTNRTRLSDYERAVGPETGLILKVHTSNFRIVGFHRGGRSCLSRRAREEERLARHGRFGERLLSSSLTATAWNGNPPCVTVSQPVTGCPSPSAATSSSAVPRQGSSWGRRDVLERIRKNPLNRALRIDKLTLAALEANDGPVPRTGDSPHGYPRPEGTDRTPRDAVTEAGDGGLFTVLRRALKETAAAVTLSIVEGSAMAGGGSLPGPGRSRRSWSASGPHPSPRPPWKGKLRQRGRHLMIARVAEDQVLFDLPDAG